MSKKVHCPYNPNHEFSEDKLISHVIKCAKRYPNSKDLQCPYVSTHFIPPPMYQQHILNECEGRPTQEQLEKIVEYNKAKQKKKSVKNKEKAKETRVENGAESQLEPQGLRTAGIELKDSDESKHLDELSKSENKEIKKNEKSKEKKWQGRNKGDGRKYGNGKKEKEHKKTQEKEEPGIADPDKNPKPAKEEEVKEVVESTMIKQSQGFTLTKKKLVVEKPVDNSIENEKIASERQKDCQNQIF